jgi:hypothetical protein
VITGDNWQTPEWIFDLVREVGPIGLDPCTNDANPANADRFLTPDSLPDGLIADWLELSADQIVWCNPPYGRSIIGSWIGKILVEVGRGCEVIALTRGDTSTEWARAMFAKARLVCFPPRIRFRGATGSPNFWNLLFYFGPRPETFRRVFANVGPIVSPITSPRVHQAAHGEFELPAAIREIAI